MTPPPGTAGRLEGLDALKGVAILMVVAIHAAPEPASWYQSYVVNGVARLAVPCFLVVSGYLAAVHRASRQKLAGYFIKFLRLHVVYGAFYWVVDIARNGFGTPSLKAALLHFGEASYAGQYFFIILLQLFFVAAFLLPEGFWRSTRSVVLTALVALAGFSVRSFVLSEPAWTDGLGRVLGRALTSESTIWLWLYYFTLGAHVGDRKLTGRFPALFTQGGLCATLLGLALLGSAANLPSVPGHGEPSALPYTRLAILTGATLVALTLPGLASRHAPGLLTRLGLNSFGLYVFNPALLAVLFTLAGYPEQVGPSLLSAAVVALAALPLTAGLRRVAPALLA
jgi:surface polysaccharide O-acyltransferase-like enzyme